MNVEEYTRMHALESQYWWFVGRRAIVAELAGAALVRQGRQRADALLDIGCGTGANLPLLKELVDANGQLVGADFSPLALRYARQQLGNGSLGVDGAASPRLSLLQADAARLPFADNSFDLVTALDVLEHVENDSAALSEITRVLVPGGAFIWSVPAYQHLWSAHDEALHHFRRYEYHQLRSKLTCSGLQVWRLSFAMSLMPPAAWLWRKVILPWVPKRPRDATRHSQGAVLPQVPPAVNALLVRLLQLEGKLIPHRRLNFGTSLVGIAFKPLRDTSRKRDASDHAMRVIRRST